MPRRTRIPAELGERFSYAHARELGVTRSRLRGRDLAAPFRGVRTARELPGRCPSNPDDARTELLLRARDLATALRPDEFFSHETAAVIWGAPLPPGSDLGVLHVSVHDGAVRRMAGVRGHRLDRRLTTVGTRDGLRVASPASTWAALGAWSVTDLTALGDHICRVWREGVGRPSPGRLPLATPEQMRRALDAGQRRGAARLRRSLSLTRLDSWSPRETGSRLILLAAGLPEPSLNRDVFDGQGAFLGCVDMAFEQQRIALEYQGRQHADTYAHDVERLARLRAAGWIVIEITAELYARPEVLAARVRAALTSRGRPD